MNNKLLLALDLDGTLLNSALEISPATKKKLLEFQDRGHLVTIATGRPFQGARRFALELNLASPLILNNGALVAEADGKVHKFYPVDTGTGHELLQYCRDRNLPCSFFIGQEIYMLRPHALSARLHETHDLTVPKVADNPEEMIARGVTNYVITMEPEQVQDAYPLLQKEFGTRLQVVRAGTYFIDIIQGGVSKGQALQDLALSLGIQRSNVIAVGDNHNDLEMLEYAGLGVTMADADDLVKQTANYVTAGNDEDGIAALVDKILASGDHLALISS